MKNLIFAVIICLTFTSCEQIRETQKQAVQIQMSDIYQQVIDQELKKWEIINRNGSNAEKFMQANIIYGCYLQAGNEAKYIEWKAKAEIFNPMKGY